MEVAWLKLWDKVGEKAWANWVAPCKEPRWCQNCPWLAQWLGLISGMRAHVATRHMLPAFSGHYFWCNWFDEKCWKKWFVPSACCVMYARQRLIDNLCIFKTAAHLPAHWLPAPAVGSVNTLTTRSCDMKCSRQIVGLGAACLEEGGQTHERKPGSKKGLGIRSKIRLKGQAGNAGPKDCEGTRPIEKKIRGTQTPVQPVIAHLLDPG